MTFETFDQRDEETWPDQQKENDNDNDNDNDKDKDILRTPPKSHPRDLWPSIVEDEDDGYHDSVDGDYEKI